MCFGTQSASNKLLIILLLSTIYSYSKNFSQKNSARCSPQNKETISRKHSKLNERRKERITLIEYRKSKINNCTTNIYEAEIQTTVISTNGCKKIAKSKKRPKKTGGKTNSSKSKKPTLKSRISIASRKNRHNCLNEKSNEVKNPPPPQNNAAEIIESFNSNPETKNDNSLLKI